MTDYSDMAARLRERLAELVARAEEIEDDLRRPLDVDFSEQAIDLADDEALEGIDEVLRTEARQVRAALERIANGTYGTCTNCGAEIPRERLEAQPVASACIKCAA